jgi:polysaccharide pyruvyl transferase WcaK-like protein
MKKVFLVTKLKTTNLGNQALSMELIKLFQGKVGKENLFVGGRPLGLYGYSINALKSSSDPVKLFESWADAVVKKFRSLKTETRFVSRTGDFNLTNKKSLKFEGLKTMLRPVKRVIKKYFLFDKSYIKRLATINSCDYLIYSGAGEASDNHVFLRQMLELRIAQKLGKKTGAVNQSVVVKDEAFKKVVQLVYGNMNQIVVRGATTKAGLVSFGVDESKVAIAPDTAIRTSSDFQGVAKNGKVGINFTPFIKFEWKDIDTIINKLRQHKREMVFVTNEPLGDIPIINEFKSRYNIYAMEACSDYLEFQKKLAAFDYIVSTRLHTNVMSLAANVPVIPIEGLVFKTRELLSQFEYPIYTINVNEPGWVDEIVKAIDSIESHAIDFEHYFKKVIGKHKEDVNKNVSWINNN